MRFATGLKRTTLAGPCTVPCLTRNCWPMLSINMAQNPEALLIDAGDEPADPLATVVAVDFSTLVLPVLQANPQELIAHEEV